MKLTKINVLLVLTSTFLGGAATADEIGPAGAVQSIDVRTTLSDLFLQAHGEVVILQSSDKQSVAYRWGGASCGSKVVPADQVAYLMDLAAEPYMLIEPKYQSGQGDTKCLVGFKAFNTKYE